VEQIHPEDSGPARRTLPGFAEERQALALHVHGDERVVGGGQILRRGDDVVALVGAHGDGHVAWTVSRVPAVLVEPRQGHLAQLAVFGEWLEGRAAIDALVLVDFSASLTLAVIHTDVDIRIA